jgi:hypothetical protein
MAHEISAQDERETDKVGGWNHVVKNKHYKNNISMAVCVLMFVLLVVTCCW